MSRWNNDGLARNGRPAKSEDGAKEGGGLFVWIGLEIRMNVGSEGGANSRERTDLQEQMRWLARQDDR